jgi:K(+)-stimulated pyrophosphate-energized sodium pump
MANAGGAWDNAKKCVEIDPAKLKGTALHDATVIGDTVGDPFKDTSSVSMNPIIKFSTLFGLLATEIAIELNPVAHSVNAAIKSLGDSATAEQIAAATQAAVASSQGITNIAPFIGIPFLIIALIFVWRSFYAMRIPKEL